MQSKYTLFGIIDYEIMDTLDLAYILHFDTSV